MLDNMDGATLGLGGAIAPAGPPEAIDCTSMRKAILLLQSGSSTLRK